MPTQQQQWEQHWQHPQYRSVSLEEAITISLRRVPGKVVKAELDYDDGLLLYEIDIRTEAGMKYEVKVNAITGEITKVKLD